MKTVVNLSQLAEGQRFLQPQLGVTGTVVYSSDLRCRVRLGGDRTRRVSFEDRHGNRREFTAVIRDETDWAPTTLVIAERVGR